MGRLECPRLAPRTHRGIVNGRFRPPEHELRHARAMQDKPVEPPRAGRDPRSQASTELKRSPHQGAPGRGPTLGPPVHVRTRLGGPTTPIASSRVSCRRIRRIRPRAVGFSGSQAMSGTTSSAGHHQNHPVPAAWRRSAPPRARRGRLGPDRGVGGRGPEADPRKPSPDVRVPTRRRTSTLEG